MQRIYLLDIKGFTDESHIKALLSPEQIAKAEGYANGADRLRSLFGSLLIKKFTAKSPLLFGAYGKPYKEEPPFFNISHSGDKVGIFLSGDGEVGFDIQKIKDYNARLAERIFPEKEIKISCAADFAKFWTLKEAAAKLDGKGVNPEKRILTDITENAFTCCGNKVYYKHFLQGEYSVTACAYREISARVFEINVNDLINF